jgi:hypothetical protein
MAASKSLSPFEGQTSQHGFGLWIPVDDNIQKASAEDVNRGRFNPVSERGGEKERAAAPG